jgi:hypothetical protein
MTRSSVVAGDLAYTVSGLEPRARGDLHQAVVTARIIDAVTGLSVTGRLRVSTTTPGLRPCTAPGGYVGLAGIPSRVLPDLAATPYDVTMQVQAAGLLPLTLTASLGPQATFPTDFAAAHLGAVLARRDPVVLQVSTNELDATNRSVPLAGAGVVLTGVWEALADLDGGPTVPPLLAIAPGLSTPRPAGAVVDRPALAAPAEPARSLLAGAARGDTVVTVSRAGAFVGGDLLGLDLGAPDRAERIEVVNVDGPVDPESPARLELGFPLAHAHPATSAATRLTVGAAPPPTTTTRDTQAGERTLPLTSTGGFAAGQVVRIAGGTAGAEFHVADLYAVITDARGLGALPPLTGYAAARVVATTATVSSTDTVTLTPPRPSLDLTLT